DAAAEARRIAEELTLLSPEIYKDELALASIYLGLGEKESGYRYLESLFEKTTTRKKRFIYRRYIDLDRNFDGVRNEKRFKEIIWGSGLTFQHL
ncbi:MAG: hypothetical protein ACE5LC_10580, partial [Candidatus Aminicenantales bacterium]